MEGRFELMADVLREFLTGRRKNMTGWSVKSGSWEIYKSAGGTINMPQAADILVNDPDLLSLHIPAAPNIDFT